MIGSRRRMNQVAGVEGREYDGGREVVAIITANIRLEALLDT